MRWFKDLGLFIMHEEYIRDMIAQRNRPPPPPPQPAELVLSSPSRAISFSLSPSQPHIMGGAGGGPRYRDSDSDSGSDGDNDSHKKSAQDLVWGFYFYRYGCTIRAVDDDDDCQSFGFNGPAGYAVVDMGELVVLEGEVRTRKTLEEFRPLIDAVGWDISDSDLAIGLDTFYLSLGM
ncbi:hypothetical protein B484DRAFT_452090 [Ochromonadaceae sp. CCMP2298]|nr:hypothetical protein B484DRAFT_452090 [Ochromonadaceae sp. CCMP2298]